MWTFSAWKIEQDLLGTGNLLEEQTECVIGNAYKARFYASASRGLCMRFGRV